ncbi:MAG: phosphoribosyl-AMP cyclohydrolase, partial [Pseudomonadota bacterium]|nr:phosphoribosyl-AMP cyclohydrolase [Pseudomonadota bacterium]
MASEKIVSADAFTARTSIEQVEESEDLAPKFDADGLIACITTDAESGEV